MDIEKLAEYFTGKAVPKNSMALSMGGMERDIAQEFFDARAALGITGYMNKDEAMAVIKKKLDKDAL